MERDRGNNRVWGVDELSPMSYSSCAFAACLLMTVMKVENLIDNARSN